MELDILRNTGCKWSKIIYPGFKGYLKPHEKNELYKSTDDYQLDPKILSEHKELASVLSPKADSEISNFNSEQKLADGMGLRSSSVK